MLLNDVAPTPRVESLRYLPYASEARIRNGSLKLLQLIGLASKPKDRADVLRAQYTELRTGAPNKIKVHVL